MIDPLERLATAIRACQPKEASELLRPCWRALSDSRTLIETLLPLTLEAIDLRFPDLHSVKLADALYHLAPEIPSDLQLSLMDAFVKHLASVAKVSLPVADGHVSGFFLAQKPSEGLLKAIARRRTLNAYYYALRLVEEESATDLENLSLRLAARDVGRYGQIFTCLDSAVWMGDMLGPSDRKYLFFRTMEYLAREAATEDPAELRPAPASPEAIVALAAGQAGFFGHNLILAQRLLRRQDRLPEAWRGHLWAQLHEQITQPEPGSEDHWPLDATRIAETIGGFTDSGADPVDGLIDAIGHQRVGPALYYLQRQIEADALSPKLLGAVLKGALQADRDPIDPYIIVMPWAAWSLARQTADPALASLIMSQAVSMLASLQDKQLSWTYQQ
jgi:hypothetical protein